MLVCVFKGCILYILQLTTSSVWNGERPDRLQNTITGRQPIFIIAIIPLQKPMELPRISSVPSYCHSTVTPTTSPLSCGFPAPRQKQGKREEESRVPGAYTCSPSESNAWRSTTERATQTSSGGRTAPRYAASLAFRRARLAAAPHRVSPNTARQVERRERAGYYHLTTHPPGGCREGRTLTDRKSVG